MNRDPDRINPDYMPLACVELLTILHTLPMPDSTRVALSDAFDKVLEDTSRRRRILQSVQEFLRQIRLDMKYLMFDLEATRRERDALEKRL